MHRQGAGGLDDATGIVPVALGSGGAREDLPARRSKDQWETGGHGIVGLTPGGPMPAC